MKRIRMLLSRDDYHHQRGYWVVAKAMSEAGLEVILGGIQTPKEAVQTAVQEDVDIIGYRLMDASPKVVLQILFDELEKAGFADIPVIIGGIVPDRDEELIREMGVKEIFRPNYPLEQIKDRVKAIVMEARNKA